MVIQVVEITVIPVENQVAIQMNLIKMALTMRIVLVKVNIVDKMLLLKQEKLIKQN
jgi:cysteine sulfinate desulfinase/cysteine desulfurase-like protein